MSTNGASGSTGAGHHIPAIADVDSFLKNGEPRPVASGGWFTKLVQWYLRRRYARTTGPLDRHHEDGANETDRAQRVIRSACVKSALTGAASGALSTGATVLTAETEGLAGIVAIPAAAVAIGGEMIYRALIHLDMACDLAEIFQVRINPDDPADFWRIYALAFHAEQHEDGEDPGKGLVEKIVHVESHEVGETIGSKLVGESVMRNVIPFVGIASSSIGNWRMTRRIGDTVRRYYRYQRALRDAFEEAEKICTAHLDLLIEGMWFIFTADGQLSPEEAAVLAGLLRKLDPVTRGHVVARFTEDEFEWAERIRELPEALRDPFLNALNVAAAVDKIVSLPERKILRRAARKLDRELDNAKLDEMIKEFSEVGVLSDD